MTSKRWPPKNPVTERVLYNRLREARLTADLTQAELADRIGVSRKTINTIENRVFIPSTVVALLLAEALGRSVEGLFFLE